MNRAIVFSHYDEDNLVAPYVLVYLKALQDIASTIIFVSTSSLSNEIQETLGTYCQKVILRENEGYDFMSYKVGLSHIDYTNYDEVVLCNDSVYGPFYPLSDAFEAMQTKPIDMWGMTENYEQSYHLQSYFLVFRKSILQSDAFENFWENVDILSKKEDIIQEYEIGLSRHLLQHAFKLDAYSKIRISLKDKLLLQVQTLTFEKIKRKLISLFYHTSISSTIGQINPSLTLWKTLIVNEKMPFIKRELLRDNPKNINVDDVYEIIGEISSYDTSLITHHLERLSRKS